MATEIRYIALGDSYTSGYGIPFEETYPYLLTKELKKRGINIKLESNLAVSGYTTQDVINHKLPIFASLRPTFATLLIGTNDIYHTETDTKTYKDQLDRILTYMQKILPQKDKIILLTIPDSSITPYGKTLNSHGQIAQKIKEFNKIINQVATKRNLQIVDIFPLTREMGKNPSLLIDDIHPSGKEHALWEKLIFPVALDILNS